MTYSSLQQEASHGLLDTDGHKMRKRKLFSIFLLLGALFVILQSVSFISAYCAEMTTYSAPCQNVPLDEVDTNFRYSETACEFTEYCSTGTCVNTITGQCTSASASTCTPDNGGIWYNTPKSETLACFQGCCILGDEASFTTSAGCDIKASQKGISPNFDATVTSDNACTALARPQEKGACVYDASTARTCEFTTREKCRTRSETTTFYEGFLCTNPTLGTNCKPTKETRCSKTTLQVLFVDTCGNDANVYNASSIYENEPNYWNYAVGTDVGIENGVAAPPVVIGEGSATNGNCNYGLGGTVCMAYNRNIDPVAPQYGSYICRTVNCVRGTFSDLFNAVYRTEANPTRRPLNGETWCGKATGTGVQLTSGNLGVASTDFSSYDKTSNNPGDTEIVFICANGKITTDVNAAYRSKVCVQSMDTNGFVSGGFVVNKWQDCYYQNKSADCLNTEKRNCNWVAGVSILKDDSGNPLVYDEVQDILVAKTGTDDTRPEASCVPKYPPGFDPSASGGATDISSGNICGLANRVCVVNLTRGIGTNEARPWAVEGGVTCIDETEGLVEDWATKMENTCKALGDCGISVNYVETAGSNIRNNLLTIIRGNVSVSDIV